MKIISLVVLLLAGIVVSGCANSRGLFAENAQKIRNDIFTEATGSEAGPGKAMAEIKFSVKSNSSRFAGKYNKHSDPAYSVHLNIDGQTTILEAEPILEEKTPIDSTKPESGIGWKYQFIKRIAIAPGKHSLKIALPIDDLLVEREIELHAGVNKITVLPVYGKRLLKPYEAQNFSAGVKSVDVVVN